MVVIKQKIVNQPNQSVTGHILYFQFAVEPQTQYHCQTGSDDVDVL